MALFERGQLGSDAFSFEQTGTLHAARTDENVAAVRSLGSDLASLSVETEWLDPAALGRYDLAPDELGGGLFLPEDGVLDPTEILQHHGDTLADGGHVVQTATAVTDIVVEDGVVTGVETTAGYDTVNVVINAAGPWAPRLSDCTGVSLPIRHTEGPILVLQSETPVSLPLTFFEEGIYLRQEGAVRALAGRMDTDYEGATELDPDEARRPEEQFLNGWTGLRTVTPDGLPIVDETRVDGYVVACGMNGFGVTYAPAIGALVAELLSREEKSDLLSVLSLDRLRG